MIFRATHKHNGRCALHGGSSTGARTPKGLQRISRANLKLGRRTKEKLAANRHSADVGRRVRAQLKRIEAQLAISSRDSIGLPQTIMHIY